MKNASGWSLNHLVFKQWLYKMCKGELVYNRICSCKLPSKHTAAKTCQIVYAFWKKSHRSSCFFNKLGQSHISFGQAATVMWGERYLDLRKRKAGLKPWATIHGILFGWFRYQSIIQQWIWELGGGIKLFGKYYVMNKQNISKTQWTPGAQCASGRASSHPWCKGFSSHEALAARLSSLVSWGRKERLRLQLNSHYLTYTNCFSVHWGKPSYQMQYLSSDVGKTHFQIREGWA
jgi:hypothetical protein